MKGKSLRKMFALLSISVLLAGVSGCSDIHKASGKTGQPNPTVTIASFSGPEADAISKLAPEFTKKTGIHIKFVKLSSNQLLSKEIISASGHHGTYDLLFINDPWMPILASGNYLYSLSHFHYKPKGFVKGAMQVVQWPPPSRYNTPLKERGKSQKFYGLPVTGNVLMFFFKKKYAQKFNVNPKHWTWKEVNQVAKAAYQPKKGEFGFVLRGSGGDPSVSDFTTVLWSFGGKFFNKDWTSALDSPQAIAALKEWLKLYHLGPSGETSFGSNEVGTYMKQKKAAMAFVWPSGWANQMDHQKIGISMVPGGKTGGKLQQYPTVGVWSLGIPKNAPHPKAAFRFMKWITAKQQQHQYAENGLDVPTRKSVILDPKLDKKYPYYASAYQSLQKGRMRPRTPGYPYVVQELGKQIVAAELGKKSPARAMKDAAKQIDQYMKEHGLVKKQ